MVAPHDSRYFSKWQESAPEPATLSIEALLPAAGAAAALWLMGACLLFLV